MKVTTKYHGVREYKNDDIIHFKKGLPGLDNLKSFILFPVEENDLFSILHSIEDENIGLIVISPFYVEKDYEIKLPDEVLTELDIVKEEDVLVLNTVTLNSEVKKITVNLRAPIIININNKLGEQIIVDNEKYAIKHPLLQG